MPTPTPVRAVFDIGKTNKKFLLFDEDQTVVYDKQITLEEIADEDGYPCENLEILVEWIRSEFDRVWESRAFRIETLNFSTYGASLVHLDSNGKPLTVLYNYLKPYPEELLEQFYERYGGRETFSLETASPPMAMLNSGLQLYWLKRRKPERFDRIRYSLHFPQYLQFLFTNRLCSEQTSVGCHTAMWDYGRNSYHSWLKSEKLLHLLPETVPVDSIREIDYGGEPLRVGPGIHDSSASLVPYQFAMDEPFLQLSTGTWSVCLNPFAKLPLSYEELQRDCLLFMNTHGKPVKASRFFLGGEYSHQLDKLVRHFGLQGTEKRIEPSRDQLYQLASAADPARKLKLEKAYHSGPFPSDEPGIWRVDLFRTFSEASHQLMLDLVSIQSESIRLVEDPGDKFQIIVTGGFSCNEFFAKLLASFFPDRNVYTALAPHASALGASLVCSSGGKDRAATIRKRLKLKRQRALEVADIQRYSWNRDD